MASPNPQKGGKLSTKFGAKTIPGQQQIGLGKTR